MVTFRVGWGMFSEENLEIILSFEKGGDRQENKWLHKVAWCLTKNMYRVEGHQKMLVLKPCTI